MNLLIVDDHATNLRLLRAQLESEGHAVLEAANGVEALEVLEREKSVEGVVSDILMPNMDGFRLCLQIRKNPRFAALPFIVYTSTYDSPEDRQLAKSVGADHYLTKPAPVADILGALHEAAQRTRPRIAALAARQDESYVLTQYNASLVRKLEERNIEVEQSLKNLQIAHDSKQESERRFRAIFDHAGVGISMRPAHDRKLPWVQVNDHFCQLLGYTRDELLKLSTADITPADGQASAISDNRRLLSDDVAGYSREKQLVRKDGRRIWVLLTVATLPGPDGRPANLIATYQDITERKQAVDELRQSESLKGAILESSLDCVLTIDHEGKIVEFNPAAAVTFGLTREQALGKVMVDLIVPPRFRNSHKRGFAQYLATGKGSILGKRLELEAIRADGTEFPIELAITAIGATSKPMFTGFIRDITARKAADAKIKRLNRVYAVLSGINTLIVRVRDRGELFSEACRIAVEQGNFGIAWIGSFDPATLDVTPVAWAGLGAKEYLGNIKSTARSDLPQGQGAVGRAIRELRPVHINDITTETSVGNVRRKEALARGYRSVIVLPLIVGGAAVGNLSLFARELNFFDDEEVKLLAELAGDISFALENIGRQQKLDKLARIRAVSSEINAAIVRIHDREALLRETCRIVVEHGKFELVWIGTVDVSKQKIQLVAWNGFSPEVAHGVSWKSSGISGGTLGEAIRTAKPTVRNDIETEMTAGGMRAEALKQGCLSAVCLPLVVDNNVVALISIFAAGRGFFDEDELKLLNEVAADVSFALLAIEKQGRLDYLAYYDVLTGLANRTLFLERVAQYIRSAAGGGHKLALYLIDLERFKNINDSLGRPAGDALLKQVAEWLKGNVGDASLLARVGTDHFAVVLPEVKQENDVARLIEKTMETFLEHPFRLNDAVFRIAAKAGAALFPDDAANAGTLFKNAESALKTAKASGDRYLFYTQKMTELVAGRLTLENQLRQALDKGEFVLHYQPKVSLASGKLTGAEALIRWNDPRMGLVPPGRFIPVLEETGLIHDVGRWALRQALSDYLRWRTAGLAAVRVAVNVSPLQLRNPGFIAEIRQAIGTDAHAEAGLELEITESLIMADVKHSIASLQAIRAMGVCIAIDDFGTGFSSLSYLARLPVDTLKIDRSFVVDMTAGPEGLALVSTIITLAHSLKLKVVAEGVETEEQLRLLRLLSCDEMQGFLFSRPLPGDIFETRFLVPPPAGMTERTKPPVTAGSVG